MEKYKISPFLKWAGGKRQLLSVIKKHMPDTINKYYEPFLGAGALLFYLQPKEAVINDVNSELINCYKVIKNNPTELIRELSLFKNTEEDFYKVRSWDREADYEERSDIEKAARMIYLNKTCFNGLYRVNSKGYFNTPYGKYKNPNYLCEENIINISRYFNSSSITIKNEDFSKVVSSANKNDFVYFDPPYFPLSATSSFTQYSKKGFSITDQNRLKNIVDELSLKGINVLISNSCCEVIKELYANYDIIEISVSRNINCDGSKRGSIKEVLIKNY